MILNSSSCDPPGITGRRRQQKYICTELQVVFSSQTLKFLLSLVNVTIDMFKKIMFCILLVNMDLLFLEKRAKGSSRDIIKHLPCMRECVHVCPSVIFLYKPKFIAYSFICWPQNCLKDTNMF